MNQRDETRAPFADQTSKQDKRQAGRTRAAHTQLDIRATHGDVDPGLQGWIHDRLGRQLGKYALQIERIQVRFGDENGPRGGEDQTCTVHVTLSKLPPVVVAARAETARKAFDLAASRAERATRRDMEKHGFSTHPRQRKDAHESENAAPEPLTIDEEMGQGEQARAQSLLGRHRSLDLETIVALEPMQPDPSQPGVSADDIRVGGVHTALRNTKGNTAGMAYRLEDSTNGRPSRKSTRAGANRTKHATPLTQRTKAAVTSPKQNAARAAAQASRH